MHVRNVLQQEAEAYKAPTICILILDMKMKERNRVTVNIIICHHFNKDENEFKEKVKILFFDILK